MAPNVKVDGSAFSDPRYKLLGKLLGTSEYDALGRMTHLWLHCTSKQLYVVPEKLVASIVDVEALVLSELGDRVDGGIRIRGAVGRVEWYQRLQESGRNSALKRWGTHNKPNGSPIGDHMGGPKEEEKEEVSLSEKSDSEKSRARTKAGEPTDSEWPVVKRVLLKLSEAAGVNYASERAGKPTSSVRFILRRLREGCTEDELRMVIRHRWLEWHDKPEMVQYLTAETIFGREKFDTYLAKAKAALIGNEPRAGPPRDPPSPVVMGILRGGHDER